MAKVLVSPVELSDAIREQFEQATAELKEEVYDEAESVANDVADKLERDSPHLKEKRKDKVRGAYARSWEVEKKTSSIGSKAFVVKNKKHYRLTHLLEHGHVNRDGSRTAAEPHIGKINDVACAEFERRVRKILNE